MSNNPNFKTTEYNALTQFLEGIKTFDKSMFGLAGGLAPWIVPVAPSLVYAFTFFQATSADMGILSIVGAIAIGIGLIVAGAMSSHTAMGLKTAGADSKIVWYAWGLVGAYILLEIGGLIAMSSTNSLKVVGVTASLLTLVVYLSRSLNTHLETVKVEQRSVDTREQEIEDAARAFEQEKERLLLEQKHLQKMAKIHQKSSPETVQSTVQATVQKSDAETQKAAILAALRDIEQSNENVNWTQLGHQLNIPRSTLYNRRDALLKSGEIYQNGSGLKVRG